MIKKIIAIAEHAGKIITAIRPENLKTETKAHAHDFVTQADKQADEYIRSELKKLFPNDLILSEESTDVPTDFSGDVWMVDPLDGTKNFVHGGDAFAVMIGRCTNGVPNLGVVYAPKQDKLFYAQTNQGAFLKHENIVKPLAVSAIKNLADATIATRIRHGETRPSDTMIESIPTKNKIESSSAGLVLGLISESAADLYVFSNKRGSKWDTCAPQIILEEAGGTITDWHGNPLDYHQESLQWEDQFIATNGLLHKQLASYIKEYSKNS